MVQQSTPPSAPISIAVMGMTGSGKSSFIKAATGYSNIVVGETLDGCTQKATAFPLEIDGTSVLLIDTPGFDDTKRYDTDILEEIATYLAVHYKHNGKLVGLIYLHPISDNRMRGTSRLNLEVFQEICGSKSLQNVVLASTMWDLVPHHVGTSREIELAANPEFWGNMAKQGSQIVRHDRSRESALSIIRSVMHKRPVVLNIQDELVNQHLNLNDTDSGRTLRREFSAREAELEKKFEQLEKASGEHQLSAATNIAKYNNLASELDKIEAARKKLTEDMNKKLAYREEGFQKHIAQAKSDSNWWKNAALLGVGAAATFATGGVALAVAGTAAAPVGVVATGAAFLGEIAIAAEGFVAVAGGVLPYVTPVLALL